VTAALPPEAAAKPVEVWFTDEARVGQQGTLTRAWAKRGSRPRAARDRRYQWAYLFGAICPERGTGAAVIMPEVNIEAMNEHLAEISHCVSIGAMALLVLDGAGWHSSPRLHVPDNIVLLPLPALLARTEPGGKRLGVPACELPQPPGLGQLRGDPGSLSRCLEQAHANARAHRLHHSALMG